MKSLYYLALMSLLCGVCSFAEVTYGGGDGTSIENAVIIESATNHFEGVDAEYVWLEMQFGPQGDKWDRLEQSLIEENDRLYDVLKVEFYDKAGGYKKGDITYFYFDITEFFRASLEELFNE